MIIEKKDSHHLCYTRKGWSKKYARKFRTDKYCIVMLPRDTIHAQIHQHLIEIPAPTEDGAEGIKLCDRWQGGYGFKNFLEDMGEKPKHGNTDGGMPLYTIDRIDASKGYCKENCRWSDWHEQAANRKNSSSHPGVVYHRPSGLWYAHKTLNRKRRQLYFRTKEEAIEQRIKWDEEDKKAPSI